MGFLDFLGHAAVHAIDETRRDTKKHNDMCYQLSYHNEQLNNYLKGVGCTAIYNADWGCLDTGSIASEVRKMDTIRKKVGEYIQLGGDVRCIDYVDEIYEVEECINKVKFLKSKNMLDRQVEFYKCKNIEAIESILESERIIQEHEELVKKREREEELLKIVGSDINSMTGVEFEIVCQKLIENMGFETETTKASGDGGIDIVAYNHQPLLSGKYIIQCKRYTGSVGEPIIRDLYGVVMSERANKGILMTTGHFTKSAETFAEGKPIELIDGLAMQNLFSQYGLSDVPTVNTINSTSNSSQSGIENVLTEHVRKFFDEKWEEFENIYYQFDACLDDLVETTNLREKVNILDTVISGLKLYEAYIMALRMPDKLDAKLFAKILGITDIGKYESEEAEEIYYAMLRNDDGLRDNIENAVLPTEEYSAGMFWTFLIAASGEMDDYDYIKDLERYHMQYLIPLATCVQCFVEEDVLEILTMGYCGDVHSLMNTYLEGK